MRRPLAIALLAIIISSPLAGQAQMRMGTVFSAPHGAPGSIARTHSGVSFSFGSRRVPHHFFPSALFFDAPFSTAYPGIIAPESPPVIVVQTGGSSPETKEPPTPSQPLLIEWQGNRYVRYGGLGPNVSRGVEAPLDYAEASNAREKSSQPRPSQAQESRRDLPAVLIFHDGRREEAASYAIVGPVMYVSSDYWSNGSWSKKIQLADLDLPATLQLNQERGVRFVLPGAPNEVVTRP
jgi:hypothetical protein